MNCSYTEFAPAERADAESISRDAKVLGKSLTDHIIHAIPFPVVVLNKQRQIVYTNQRLLDMLPAPSDKKVLGKRFGELLDCAHACENEGGCGTSRFCGECGAVKSIIDSQNEKIGLQEECRITTTSGKAYEFRVWASPYIHKNTEYTAFTLQDISNEKRREVLEYSFFHDVNNILSAIVGYSGLLAVAETPKDIAESKKDIQQATHELTNETISYWELFHAEKGDFSANFEHRVESLSLVDELIQTSIRKWPDRPSLRRGICDSFVFTTDRPLLFRILYSMMKNATEASSPMNAVSIRCEKKGSNGIFSIHNHKTMSPSTQLQVFQRSFSTKGKG
ncbi:MAG: hypothetical protein ABFR47_08380, partial [Verrucomicrobiota bacterium]